MKLADFGNVHFLPDSESVIRGLEGTVSYMSPEMRMGRYYNTKTDIWSFGMTMLNVLFDNDTNFPNFELTGPWAARKFAQDQEYLSPELKEFMLSLFLKCGDRPTAKQLLQVTPFLSELIVSTHSSRKQINLLSRNYFTNFLNRISHCRSYQIE
jgi:serine/threonine protein kinase